MWIDLIGMNSHSLVLSISVLILLLSNFSHHRKFKKQSLEIVDLYEIVKKRNELIDSNAKTIQEMFQSVEKKIVEIRKKVNTEKIQTKLKGLEDKVFQNSKNIKNVSLRPIQTNANRLLRELSGRPTDGTRIKDRDTKRESGSNTNRKNGNQSSNG